MRFTAPSSKQPRRRTEVATNTKDNNWNTVRASSPSARGRFLEGGWPDESGDTAWGNNNEDNTAEAAASDWDDTAWKNPTGWSNTSTALGSIERPIAIPPDDLEEEEELTLATRERDVLQRAARKRESRRLPTSILSTTQQPPQQQRAIQSSTSSGSTISTGPPVGNNKPKKGIMRFFGGVRRGWKL
jgi:hypothetical protein